MAYDKNIPDVLQLLRLDLGNVDYTVPSDTTIARYTIVGNVLVVCHGVFLPFYHDGLLYTYTMEGSSRAGEPVSRPSASFSEAARDA